MVLALAWPDELEDLVRDIARMIVDRSRAGVREDDGCGTELEGLLAGSSAKSRKCCSEVRTSSMVWSLVCERSTIMPSLFSSGTSSRPKAVRPFPSCTGSIGEPSPAEEAKAGRWPVSKADEAEFGTAHRCGRCA